MKVRLKVLTGGSKGKELKLKAGEFLIGRSDSCHLRPKSDAISRKHCVLFVDEKHVRVRDLKSRNGTLVNGEKIASEVELKMGDRITVGPLEFELLVTQEQAAPQEAAKNKAAQPSKVQPKKQPAAQQRVAAGRSPAAKVADDDIFGWLDEADEVDREERMTDLTTRHFKINPQTGEKEGIDVDTVDISKAEKSGDTKAGKPEKKEPGKLPPRPEKSTENSQEAAADALRQFFKRQ